MRSFLLKFLQVPDGHFVPIPVMISGISEARANKDEEYVGIIVSYGQILNNLAQNG